MNVRGQIFFRPTIRTTDDGKQVVMFVGVLAVDDIAAFNERKCELVAVDHGTELDIKIRLPGQDCKERFAGQSISTIIRTTHWEI